MELVYLWVEDYKNIKQQEFVLSSEFTFDYNKSTKTLDIQPNENNFPNFFGQNIKVTAVIGKNGSGKSNLFESIITMIYKTSIPFDDYKVFSVFFDRETKQFYTKNVEFRIDVNQIKLDDVQKILAHKKKNKNTFLLSYNYSLDYMYNDENNMNFKSIYHKQDGYKKPILLQPDKSDNKIDLVNIDYLAMRDMLNFMINKSIEFDYIENFYIPHFYKIDVNINKVHKRQNKSNKGIFYDKVKEILGDNGASMDYGVSLHSLSKSNLIELTQVYILQKTFHLEFINNFEFIINLEYKKLLQDLYSSPRTKDTSQRIDIAMKYIESDSFEKLYSDELGYQLKKVEQSFDFMKFVSEQNDSFLLSNDILKIEENKELLQNLAPWIDIELFDKNKVSFYSLSYGQKFLIKFIYSILNQLNNLDTHEEYTDIVFLLDEIEQGLHPDWQKKLLSFLLKALENYSHRFAFNVILSTHSPFILSDLRNEDVIYLDQGKVVSGIGKKQTFGADIHTLLSDGFFMNDGLMGEFSKGKIEEILSFYKRVKDEEEKKQPNFDTLRNEYDDKKNKFKYIGGILGEDYLKQMIRNHIIEIDKIILGVDIAQENKIRQLRAEADRLEKLADDSN